MLQKYALETSEIGQERRFLEGVKKPKKGRSPTR
jgi:hypothetical protein